MKNIKELTIKELDSLAMDYAFEIVERRRSIKELEEKLKIIKLETDKRIKEDKTPKLNITPFNAFMEIGEDDLEEF